MGIVNATTLCDAGFDFTHATAQDVRFAFVVKMSFRFRVPSPYHCRFENRGSEYEIWIRNKSLPESGPGMRLHSLLAGGGSIDDFWSTVIVITNKSWITDDELDALRKCDGNVDKAPFASKLKQLYPALQAINAFVIGYHTTTGELFGGHALQLFTTRNYLESSTWEYTLIGIPLSYWTAETIVELFDRKPDREFGAMTTIQGDLADLPPEKLTGIPESIDRLNDFYFYELAFESKAKMVVGDYIGALLLAVAALEGAHGAFVSYILESKLPSGRTGDDKKLEEKFIMELGFSLCSKLSPYLFMAEADRPADDLIQKAATAVVYRNEVMHALRNSAGQYRIRSRTNLELSNAYEACLQLYEIYRKALEKALSGSREPIADKS